MGFIYLVKDSNSHLSKNEFFIANPGQQLTVKYKHNTTQTICLKREVTWLQTQKLVSRFVRKSAAPWREQVDPQSQGISTRSSEPASIAQHLAWKIHVTS